jgi:hypothetical protein
MVALFWPMFIYSGNNKTDDDDGDDNDIVICSTEI